MKILFLIPIAFSFSVLGAPCGGAPGSLHVNQDGSVGGFVAKTARVIKTVIIDSSSSVCEKAVVNGSVKITGGSIVSGSAVIDGAALIRDSKVKGTSKVTGRSEVAGSSVCQASLINFNVMNSDYYCQTDDDEPSDPGVLGKKTLIGIDSNTNSIRDDVEIWINHNTSNTPKRNMYNIRQALKFISVNAQKGIVYNQTVEPLRESALKVLEGLNCLKLISSDTEYKQFSGMIRVVNYNTKERLWAWMKSETQLKGFIKPAQRKEEKACEFKIK